MIARLVSRAMAAALVVSATAAQIAIAQSPKPRTPAGGYPSAVGNWSFETAPINLNCKLSGTMTIQQAGPAGGLSCRFVAVQSCEADEPLRFEVAQTCTAKQTGADVAIDSKVDRVLKVSPADMEDAVKAYYAPDNFRIVITRKGDEMIGDFISLSKAKVRFVRSVDLTS
jgi:hypothetical protein